MRTHFRTASVLLPHTALLQQDREARARHSHPLPQAASPSVGLPVLVPSVLPLPLGSPSMLPPTSWGGVVPSRGPSIVPKGSVLVLPSVVPSVVPAVVPVLLSPGGGWSAGTVPSPVGEGGGGGELVGGGGCSALSGGCSVVPASVGGATVSAGGEGGTASVGGTSIVTLPSGGGGDSVLTLPSVVPDGCSPPVVPSVGAVPSWNGAGGGGDGTEEGSELGGGCSPPRVSAPAKQHIRIRSGCQQPVIS